MNPPARTLTTGERAFGRLGRGIVRHPWYPIVFWVVLLLVALPFLGRLATVETNSASNLSSSAPSAQASAELARLFPGMTAGSVSLLLFTGPAITGPAGQDVVVNVTTAIAADRELTYVDSIDSVYTAYQSYLTGLTEIAGATIAASLATSPTLPSAVNNSASLVWGPPAAFLGNWEGLVAAHPSTPPADWNYAAFNETSAGFAANPAARSVLSAFYNGPNDTVGGFNGSLGCATESSANWDGCAIAATRIGVAPLLASLLGAGLATQVGGLALSELGVSNFTDPASERNVSVIFLAAEAGEPGAWVSRVWSEFPSGLASVASIASWTATLAFDEPVADYPLPIPPSILTSFVDPSNDATIIFVSYSEDSGYTTPDGSTPIYSDVAALDRLVPPIVLAHDPSGTVAYIQTGGAALDQNESTDLASSLAIVLPLTILVLVLITMLYFRSPGVPLVTFSGIGLALGLGIGGVVLLGTLVSHVDQTALTLENTFVLGVGTDYAIFLVARYREELAHGADPHEAVVTSVTWAGQSIATSGATAIIATLALTVSGVALLSQWGMVLSLAVLIAVLVSLTVIPALLVLVGPRIFWPQTGARFRRSAAEQESARAAERTYFYRVGRTVARRPKTVVLLVLVASLPLLYVALTATSSYDFYAQLPAGHPATDGLAKLGGTFGNGYAFPMDLLVTFAAPLIASGAPNATEWGSISSITDLVNQTSGVASVTSPVGPSGAGLVAWLSYASASPGAQAQLNATLSSFIGDDGRTVWFTIYPTASGLSAAAVGLLATLGGELSGYQASHPEVSSVAFGGGAPTTRDIQAATALATERLAILVSLGLIVVLFVVLRSYLIPLLAVATIGVSIGWAWGITNLVLADLLGLPLFYFVPTVLFILILGLGIDYNIFLLTRVREERLNGRPPVEAIVEGLGRTGGIITAAAVILASAFAILTTGNFILLEAIGFAVATAILLDAAIVRTYLVPAALVLLKDRMFHDTVAAVPPDARSAPPADP
ncbi:MAG: MMPL family transporter [Thermoplasmata archaeon]|nr:MMPL family transporter [Thermoplasmata archaeon]